MQISSRTLLLMALAMPAILPSSGFSQPKPVPDRAAQQAAAARIKSLFADEYAAEDRAVRAKFAQQLLDLARSEKDDVNRFTLYREAVRMASEAGDAQTALSATDLMSEHFAIKPTSVKVYALSNVSKQTLPPEAAIAAADACMSLVPDCIAENEFTQAQRLIEYGQNALRRVRDHQRIAALRKLGESVADIEKQYRTVAQHAAKLKANPDDGDANLAVGKFECFAKGNWQVGLKHLSSGSDAMLRKLAAETLSNPGDAQSQFSVANGWWKQADQLDGVMEERVMAYAGNFYQRALPELTGLSKATAEKRLAEVPDTADSGLAIAPRAKSINLLELLDPAKDFKPQNKWAIANGVLRCTEGNFVPKVVFPYQPPEEYDVSFTFAQPGLRNGVGVIMPNPNGGHSFLFWVGGDGGRSLGLSSDDGKYRQRFPDPVIQKNVPYKVVVKVRKAGVQATVNGTVVVNVQTDFQDMKVSHWQRINEWENLAIYCDDPASFANVQVTEVTGEGAVTRFPTNE